MKLPVDTSPFLWGAAAGAVGLAILGFAWGGWVTGGRAETMAAERTSTAVVAALAPICVERFSRPNEIAANLAGLKKEDSWRQGDFVEKGGWAKISDADSPERVTMVAKACAVLISSKS